MILNAHVSWFFTLVILLSSTAWSGGTFVGNGGDVVVCRGLDGKIQSVELLDLHEGRVHYNLQPNLNPYLPVGELLKILFQRTKFSGWGVPQPHEDPLAEFDAEANYLPNTTLVDIPDSWHLSFPDGCLVEQIAIQINPKWTFEKRYTIDEDLWKKLNNVHRAALVFHELLYRHKIEQAKATTKINSRDVRYLVALAAADRVAEAFPDPKHYLEFLTLDIWVEAPFAHD